MGSQVLIAHTAPHVIEPLLRILADCNCTVLTAHSVKEAQYFLGSQPIATTFCESHLPDGGCIELLRWCKVSGISARLIVSPATANESEYIDLMAQGAFDYIVPPYRRTDVELLLRRRERRIELNIPVQAFGVTNDGIPFLQSCCTRNISREGACLSGLKYKPVPYAILGTRCHEKEGHVRVAWVTELQNGGYEAGVHVVSPIDELWCWQIPDHQEPAC